MKKVSLLLVLVLMAFAGMAQEENSSSDGKAVKFGVRMGYNLSSINKFLEFKDGLYGWKSGINFGVVADFQLTDKIAFRPGLYYSMKGEEQIGIKGHRNFLETPLLVVFQQPLGNKLKLELQAGPYLGAFVGSKYKFTSSYSEEYYGSYDWLSHVNDIHRKCFDWGLNLGCGLQYGKVYMGVSFEDGFISQGRNSMHHNLMANVGYSF